MPALQKNLRVVTYGCRDREVEVATNNSLLKSATEGNLKTQNNLPSSFREEQLPKNR